ncbi:MAG: alpha/beta hydrolase [Candidatus Helarchaeota archaeon]|nr:alpha/beta hydrolase [Candidatus Helarchaeota archaeon]
MKSKKIQYSLFFVFIGLTLLGIVGLNVYPANVIRSTHQVATSNGIISFNLYQQRGLSQSTPVIVMGHGIIVNKEMMTNFAIELANYGFIVANLDWSGHGQSTSPFGNLTEDLEAVISQIPLLQPLANMSAMGLLGYSLGGFGTYPYAINNSNVKAWVGVGTRANGDISNTTNPRNVLMIIGSLDEALSPEDAKVPMVNLINATSVDEVEFEREYGNISIGTARKIHVVPGADHLITPWHRDFVVPAVNWTLRSFGMSLPTTFAFDVRTVFVWVGFFGLVGLTFCLAVILADKFDIRKKPDSTKNEIDPKVFENHSLLSFVGKFALFTLGLLPTILLFVPLLLFTPLPLTSALTALVGSFAINILIYTWRLAKRWNVSLKAIIKENLFQKSKVWIYAIILTAIFFVCYYFIIGLNYLGMIPPLPRIPYLILYSLILFLLLFSVSIFLQKFSVPYSEYKFNIKSPIKSYLTVSFTNFLSSYSWFLILILVPCILMGNFFFAMILILLIPILLFLVFFGVYMEKLTGSVIPGALLNAIMITFVIVTLTPFADLMRFFGIFI